MIAREQTAVEHTATSGSLFMPLERAVRQLQYVGSYGNYAEVVARAEDPVAIYYSGVMAIDTQQHYVDYDVTPKPFREALMNAVRLSHQLQPNYVPQDPMRATQDLFPYMLDVVQEMRRRAINPIRMHMSCPAYLERAAVLHKHQSRANANPVRPPSTVICAIVDKLCENTSALISPIADTPPNRALPSERIGYIASKPIDIRRTKIGAVGARRPRRSASAMRLALNA